MAFSWEFANTPAGRILKAIQLRGRASIKEIAADLGVTTSAVRLHLSQLQASDAIRAEMVREGVGRPHYVYSATARAHSLLQRDYGELTRLLLAEVTEMHGPDALQEVLRSVGKRLADMYRDDVERRQYGDQELADRVDAWMELLDRRGVTAEIERTTDGYVLREYGCAYQNVAVENRAICEMERQVMTRLLESGVKLTQCVLDGHHGCHFAIVEEKRRQDG